MSYIRLTSLLKPIPSNKVIFFLLFFAGFSVLLGYLFVGYFTVNGEQISDVAPKKKILIAQKVDDTLLNRIQSSTVKQTFDSSVHFWKSEAVSDIKKKVGYDYVEVAGVEYELKPEQKLQIDIAAIRAGAVIKEDLFDIANDLLQNGELRAAAIEAFAHSADLKEILSYFSDSDPIVREAALRSAMGVDMDEESVAEVLSATTSQIKNEVDPYVLETGLEFIIANSPEKAEIILSSIVSREDSSAACVLTVINFLAEYKDQGELIEYFISLPGASRFIDDKDFVSQLYTNS